MLLFTTAGHATNGGLYSNLPYDPVKDFTPICMITRSSGFALLVQANLSLKSIQDLISKAKSEPDSPGDGSFGNSNTTHVIGAKFSRAADVKVVHVSYKFPVTVFWGSHPRPIGHSRRQLFPPGLGSVTAFKMWTGHDMPIQIAWEILFGKSQNAR